MPQWLGLMRPAQRKQAHDPHPRFSRNRHGRDWLCDAAALGAIRNRGGDMTKETEMTKLNIAQRISACMNDVDYIQKERKDGMKYTIVSHDAVTAKVRPILHKHGVVYYPRDLHVTQDGNRTQAVFAVRFENIDDRADFIDVATFGYGVDPQDKGPGKAMSYGVKYALLKVLGLETGDDPDTVQDAKAYYKAPVGTGEPQITDHQRAELQGLIDATRTNIVAMCQFYKIGSLPEMASSQFDHAKISMENKLTKKGKVA